MTEVAYLAAALVLMAICWRAYRREIRRHHRQRAWWENDIRHRQMRREVDESAEIGWRQG